ncbi:MAG: serine hydrolase [Myxococcota bacterium]|nr:serine hydrolase [Myxococcota bacterium]
MRRALLVLCLLLLSVGLPSCALLLRLPTLRAREQAFQPESLVWTFRHMGELFPTRTISHAEPVSALPIDEAAIPASLGETWLEAFVAENRVQGLVVVRGDQIVLEGYAEGAGPETRFTSWSVAKSFVATRLAVALEEGQIGSLDERLSRYVPELADGAYREVTFRQALHMSSGVRFTERYQDRDTDVFGFLSRSLFTNREPADRIAASFPRAAEPGASFNYNTAETQVLAWALREATGESLAAGLARKVWAPLGMAHDASWALDREGPDGTEVAGCCLNATLRDWARLGQLHLRGGRTPDGRVLLSPEWVEGLARTQAPHLAPGVAVPGSPWGYGFHWWHLSDGVFAARGVYGQYIWVDPSRDVVIALASAWDVPWGEAQDAPVRAALARLAGRFGASGPLLGQPASLAP